MVRRSIARPRWLVGTIAAITVMVIVGACSSSGGSGTEPTSTGTQGNNSTGTPGNSKPEKASIVIGTANQSAGFMTTYVADAEGFFQKEGLSVKLLPFEGSPAALQGLIGGQADALVLGFPSLLNLYGTPQQPVVIRESNSAASYFVFGKKGVTSWQQVASSHGTMGVSAIGGQDHQLAQYMATQAGVKPSDIKFQASGTPAQVAASLIAGRLDAAIVAASAVPALQEANLPVLGKLSDVLNRFPLEVYAVSKSFYQSNPNTVAAIVRADQAAAQWIKDHSDSDVVDVLAKYYPIPATQHDDAVAALAYYRAGIGLDGYSEDGMKIMTQFGIDDGRVKASDPNAVMADLVPELK